jgi:hypothetical protein
MNLFRGKIVDILYDGCNRGYALVQQCDRRLRGRRCWSVVAPLINGGLVTLLTDGRRWIQKGTLSCIPPRGTEIYYDFCCPKPGKASAFTPVWCEANAWDEWDDEETLRAEEQQEILNLMMPGELYKGHDHPSRESYRLGTRRKDQERTESQWDPYEGEEEEWLGDIICPIRSV